MWLYVLAVGLYLAVTQKVSGQYVAMTVRISAEDRDTRRRAHRLEMRRGERDAAVRVQI